MDLPDKLSGRKRPIATLQDLPPDDESDDGEPVECGPLCGVDDQLIL